MIPPIIHYCWFGGTPLPDFARACIETWRRVMPDVEIREWNESNWDVESNSYASAQFRRKKFAFVSDVCRIDVLERYGGIYLDTDVVLNKPLTPFLHHEAFLGMMFSDSVGTAVIGASPGNALVRGVRRLYDDLPVSDVPNNDLLTGFLIDTYPEFVLGNRAQVLTDGTAIYPRTHFERFSRHPRRGYSRHLVSNTWHDHASPLGNALPSERGIRQTIREWLGNARTIPRAAHFRTYVAHAIRLERPRKDDTLVL